MPYTESFKLALLRGILLHSLLTFVFKKTLIFILYARNYIRTFLALENCDAFYIV